MLGKYNITVWIYNILYFQQVKTRKRNKAENALSLAPVDFVMMTAL